MKRVKISVDLGNSMIKAATYINSELATSKLANRIQHTKTISPKAKKICIDNKEIYLGVGELNNNVLKHTRQNLFEQVLVMIHELYPTDDSLGVELVTGLPPIQLFNEAYLKEFQEIFTNKGAIKFAINGVKKKVEITSIAVFAEGYSGFVSVVDDITTKQDILSIDVGGSTTDLCNYTFDYDDDMYYPDVTDTVGTGVIEFTETIANDFNNKHGADIKALQIDHILKNNLNVIEYEGREYDLDTYIKSIESLIDSMLNKITNKFGKLDRYAIVGIGGGYKTFEKIAKKHISKKINIDAEKQFYANSIGYLEQ